MADRTVKVRLEAIVGPYQAAMAQATQATRKLQGEVAGLARVNQQTAQSMQPLGTAMLAVGAAFAASGALAVKAAIDYESAFAGVEKTVDGTKQQISALSEGIRAMALEVPATTTEIAAVAEAAGALGVETDSILGFTRVMIDLGETTNLTSDQAAVAFARIANVMGTASSDFDRMGAAVVALGNNGASTEAEIVEFANRLAAAGAIAGLSEAEVLAFSETLASVGVEAEAGGTALSKVFISVRDAVLTGSDQLETFAQVAGVTASEFASMFQADAAGAITSFVEGIGRINDAGQSTTSIFEDLELTDQRLMRALLSTGKAGDYLRGQIELANGAWEENSALTDEARKRYETTAAQIEILRNNIADLAVSFGTALLPAIKVVADILGNLVDGFRDLPGPVQTMVAASAILTGGVMLLGGAFLFLLPRIQAAQAGFATLTLTSPALAAGLRGVMLAAGGIGAVLTVASIAVAVFGDHNDDAAVHVNDFTEALRRQADGARDAVRALIVKKLVDDDLDKSARNVGLSLNTVAAAIEGDAKALAKVKDATSAIEGVKEMTLLPRGEEMKKVRDAVLGMAGDLDTARDKQNRTADVSKKLGVETEKTGEAFSGAASEVDTLTDALDEYLNGILGVQQASDGFASSLIDLATQLRDQTEESGRAGASLTGMSDAALANRDAMGQAVQRAADWVEAMNGQQASQEEIGRGLAQMAADLIATAVEMGASAEEARVYANMILGIPTSADTKVNIDTGQAIQSLDEVLAKLNQVSAMSADIGPIVASIVGGAPAQSRPAPAAPRAATPRPASSRSGADASSYLEGLWRARMEAVENRFKAGEVSLEDYERSLDEQMSHEVPWTNAWVALQEKKADAVKYWSDKVGVYLHLVQDHQRMVEDNMFAVADLGKDRYLEILQERLAGLEKYSDEWLKVWQLIKQVSGEALDMEIAVIQAYEEGRLFQQAWDILANQRMLSDQYLTPASSYSTASTTTNSTTWAPTFNAYGSDSMEASATNNQKLRDYAALAG